MEQPARPVPVPDDLSGGFWHAAAQHQLVAQECDHCKRLAYPPSLMCSGCLTHPASFSWRTLSGTGTVRTWTVVRDAFLPGFARDVPYVVADVELPEQVELRLIARLMDVDPVDMAIGIPVEVRFETVADGVAVPYFVRSEP